MYVVILYDSFIKLDSLAGFLLFSVDHLLSVKSYINQLLAKSYDGAKLTRLAKKKLTGLNAGRPFTNPKTAPIK